MNVFVIIKSYVGIFYVLFFSRSVSTRLRKIDKEKCLYDSYIGKLLAFVDSVNYHLVQKARDTFKVRQVAGSFSTDAHHYKDLRNKDGVGENTYKGNKRPYCVQL